MSFLNPISPIQVGGQSSVNRNFPFGVTFSNSIVGGYMQVNYLTDLIYTIPSGTTGNIEYSGNSIPINFLKGTGSFWSPDVLTLNSDNLSSGRRKIGMLVHVREQDQIYQYTNDNFLTLWNAATAATGTIVISEFGTTVNNTTLAGQNFINSWTASTIDGYNGVNRTNAVWKKYYGTNLALTGASFNTFTGTLTLTNITGGTQSLIGFGSGGGGSTITGGTFDHDTGVLSLNSTGGTITITGFTDVYVTGGTYNSGTTTLSLFNTTGGTIVITGFTSGGGGGSSNLQYFITGSTPSGVTINSGDRWFDTDTGVEVVYINDGDSSQWVRPSNGVATLFTGNTSATCITSLYVSNIYGCSPININDLVIANSGLFTNNLTATTISATTYQNLPSQSGTGVSTLSYTPTSGILTLTKNDVTTLTAGTFTYLTGFSYSNNIITSTNNLGGNSNVTINTLTGLTINGGLTVTGNTSLQGLTATTISATTYQNLPSQSGTGVSSLSYTPSTGILTLTKNDTTTVTAGTFTYLTGVSYSNNVVTLTNNNGGVLTATIDTVTGLTVNGVLIVTGNTSLQGLTATTISATTYQNIPIKYYKEFSAAPSTSPIVLGTDSISIGNGAESRSTYMLSFGTNAGKNATSTTVSNFIGSGAGYDASGSTYVNFIGPNAGYGALSANSSTFLNSSSGNFSTGTTYSNIFGTSAGESSKDLNYSNILGYQAGLGVTNAQNVNYFGRQSGWYATNATFSNFIGFGAGTSATNASYSNFIGSNAGTQASSASFSNLIGFNAGKLFTGNNIGSNNIIIGTNLSLPNGAANSLNIGGVLFGTGLYSNTGTDPLITPVGGRIGINVVSASTALHVGGDVTVTGFTSSLSFTGGSDTISGTKGSVITNGSTGTAFIVFSGSNTVGGAGYTDFIRVTNTAAGAINPTKTLRVNNTGALEVINSVYTATTLSITDNGILYVGGGNNATSSSNDATSNYLSFNSNNSQIYDDGNFHIHSRGANQAMWINSNNGQIILGAQSPTSTGGIASAISFASSTVNGYVTINSGRTVTTAANYGYLTTGGAGTYGGGSQSVVISLYANNRIWGQEIDAFSDERMKDIHGEITLEEGIKLIKNLKPIKYNWKEGDDKGIKAGYSAQQVIKSGFDHLIGLIPTEGLEETIDDDGFLSPKDTQFAMNYDQVTPYHGVVIKHLLEEIENLKNEIKELKSKIG